MDPECWMDKRSGESLAIFIAFFTISSIAMESLPVISSTFLEEQLETETVKRNILPVSATASGSYIFKWLWVLGQPCNCILIGTLKFFRIKKTLLIYSIFNLSAFLPGSKFSPKWKSCFQRQEDLHSLENVNLCA